MALNSVIVLPWLSGDEVPNIPQTLVHQSWDAELVPSGSQAGLGYSVEKVAHNDVFKYTFGKLVLILLGHQTQRDNPILMRDCSTTTSAKWISRKLLCMLLLHQVSGSPSR